MNSFFKYNQHGSRGQALIIAVVFFTATSLAVASVISTPIVKSARIASEGIRSKGSFTLAEALTEDIVYRYKAGLDVESTETLTLDGHTATAAITTTPSGRTVVVEGDVDDRIRRVQTDLVAGVGASFGYGVQVGTGGFVLNNNSVVDGNVYTNGNIVGSNGARITGSAFAANSAALTSNQSNTAPATPPNTIVFRNAAASQDAAQSFVLTETGRINKVQVYIRKTGNPANATVRIVSSSGSNPSSATLASGTLVAAQVTTTLGWVDVVFASNPELSAGSTYWIVIDNSTNNASNYYTWGANSAYASGGAKVGAHAGTWSNTTPSGLDAYFSVFLGGLTSTISGVTIGTAGVGDAHAHTVNNSTIAGSLYCATGSGNNKACNTTQSDPAPQGFPISQANIDQWKSEAEAGGVINGNVTWTATSTTLGPKKINGNLTITNNATLTMTGTVWVTGTITLSNNVSARLSSDYDANSGVLLADGRISLSNNSAFQGSGQAGSYMLLLTTSNCPLDASCGGHDAMELGNNVGTVVLNAQNGTLFFSNNAGAKQATAHTIELDNNAVIQYETGLIDLNFVSGPGGSFDITGWKEVE